TAEGSLKCALYEGPNKIDIGLDLDVDATVDGRLRVTWEEDMEFQPTLWLLPIAIQDYRVPPWHPLHWPQNDAQDLAQKFRLQGGDGHLFRKVCAPAGTPGDILLDPNRAQLKECLSGLRSAEADDLVIVSVSAHGMVEDGSFYIVLRDGDTFMWEAFR